MINLCTSRLSTKFPIQCNTQKCLWSWSAHHRVTYIRQLIWKSISESQHLHNKYRSGRYYLWQSRILIFTVQVFNVDIPLRQKPEDFLVTALPVLVNCALAYLDVEGQRMRSQVKSLSGWKEKSRSESALKMRDLYFQATHLHGVNHGMRHSFSCSIQSWEMWGSSFSCGKLWVQETN